MSVLTFFFSKKKCKFPHNEPLEIMINMTHENGPTKIARQNFSRYYSFEADGEFQLSEVNIITANEQLGNQ